MLKQARHQKAMVTAPLIIDEHGIMKNKQEILGLIINIVLVALLLCFIVAGLNIIGIYSLPKPIEKLLGTNDDEPSSSLIDDISMYGSSDFNHNDSTLVALELSYENAYAILSKLQARKNYTHSLKNVNYYGGLRRAEAVNIKRADGLYDIIISDESDSVLKSVSENENGSVVISESYNNEEEAVKVDKGSFSINEECGFVLDAREFLESGYDLTAADFRQFNNDYGVCISVDFDYVYNNRRLRQKYVFSLDYGVAVEAFSYENDTLVYEMLTDSISIAE